MRIEAALLCAALVAAPLRAQEVAATPEDARAVVAAVLAHQASLRGPESGAEACVVGMLAGPPAPPDGDDPMVPAHAVRFRFQWHAPEQPQPPRPVRREDARGRRIGERAPPVPPPAMLGPALADRLNALRRAASAAPASAGLTQIDAALVPAPLQLQGRNADCAPLALSVPTFAGDAAFVEIAFACGTVCGNGSLYALQRREGRWEVVGVGDVWIS